MNPNLRKLILAAIAAPAAAASAWLVGAVAKYGIHLDKSGVNAAFITGAGGALALAAKLIHDLERKLERDHLFKHEQLLTAEHDVEHVVTQADPALGAELGWPANDPPAPGSQPAGLSQNTPPASASSSSWSPSTG